MAKVFCMASAKGGSGKTLLTATFGGFLVAVGKKVLLVDTDAATNGLTLLHLKEVLMQGEYALSEGRHPHGVYEAVSTEHPAEVVHLQNGVDLVPATYRFIDTEDVPLPEYAESLKRTLDALRPEYDYIFLDAQAGSDNYAQLAMSRKFSDEVVIVSEYDPMSAAGVERLKGLMREDLTYVRTWVLLNKMLPDFVQSFSDFLEVAKYLSPIPWDADVVRAYARRKTALDLDHGNEHTLAVMQTLRSLFGDEIAGDVNAWAQQRAEGIRRPIEEQYRDAERELGGLLEEQQRMSLATVRRQRRLLFLYLLGFVLLVVLITFLAVQNPEGQKGDFPLYTSLTAVSIAFLALVTELLFIKRNRKVLSVGDAVEQSRFRRREAILEERLRMLEALREADLDTLIRTNSRKATSSKRSPDRGV